MATLKTMMMALLAGSLAATAGGMYLIPVAAVALAALFFGDPLTSARVLGGLIVLLGVILTRVALDRAARLR